MLAVGRERVGEFLKQFVVKESRFGRLNPISLVRDVRPCPLIYNARVYYLKDEEERDAVIKNPSLLISNRPVPLDVNTPVAVLVIGKAKTGKTTLAKTLS